MKRLWTILLVVLSCHYGGATHRAHGFDLLGGGCSDGCRPGQGNSGGMPGQWQPVQLPSVLGGPGGRMPGAPPMAAAGYAPQGGPMFGGPMSGGHMSGGPMSRGHMDHGPYPDVWAQGGSGYQNLGGTCCGPNWWDFRAEAVFLKRELGDSMPIMSDGIRGLGPPNTVLSSGAQFNYEPAFRVAGRFQMSAVTSIEAEYLGGLDWDDRKIRFGNISTLYSAFSDFGNSPFGGFEDSDQASSTSLDYDAELDVIEVNYRRGWTTRAAKTHGSWLCGVRYARIEESLVHQINVTPHFDPINMIPRPAAFTNYDIKVDNDLVGLQIGSELTHCLSPGILISGEAKAGVYGNHARLRSTIVSSTLPGGLPENESDTGAAFGSNSRVYLLWQFHPLWKLKTGYEVMYFDGVATASGNYNAAPFLTSDPSGNPFVGPPREARLDDHDDLLYHGFHIGLEFGW